MQTTHPLTALLVLSLFRDSTTHTTTTTTTTASVALFDLVLLRIRQKRKRQKRKSSQTQKHSLNHIHRNDSHMQSAIAIALTNLSEKCHRKLTQSQQTHQQLNSTLTKQKLHLHHIHTSLSFALLFDLIQQLHIITLHTHTHFHFCCFTVAVSISEVLFYFLFHNYTFSCHTLLMYCPFASPLAPYPTP